MAEPNPDDPLMACHRKCPAHSPHAPYAVQEGRGCPAWRLELTSLVSLRLLCFRLSPQSLNTISRLPQECQAVDRAARTAEGGMSGSPDFAPPAFRLLRVNVFMSGESLLRVPSPCCT